MMEIKHTCRNCGNKTCYLSPKSSDYHLICWRPSLRVIIARFALLSIAALALVVATVLVWAWLAGALKPVLEYHAQATDFPFYEREKWQIEDLKRWRVKSAVVWTIYSTVGPDDGYAISKGE